MFDAGGTLVRLDFEWISTMLDELGVAVTPADLRRCELRGRRMYDAVATRPLAPGETPEDAFASTTGPGHAYLAGMLEAAGVRHPVLEEALARMQVRQQPDTYLWGRPVEGAREALDALPALGVRLCCVSNADGRAERLLELCGVRAGLEFVIDSHLVGFEKPDPRIFALALARLGVEAERALYVGDIRSVDEAGAHAARMHFVLIDPFGDYGANGSHRIAGIDELPTFVARTFTTPAGENHGRTR